MRKEPNEIDSSTYKITVRMTREERKMIDEQAHETGDETISTYVRNALRWFRQHMKIVMRLEEIAAWHNVEVDELCEKIISWLNDNGGSPPEAMT